MNLKPCPFCGGEAKEEQTRGSFGGYGLTTVYCQACGVSAPNVDKWNKRVDDLASAAEARYQKGRKEQLKSCLKDILDAHKQSCVDWEAMRVAEDLLA